MGKPSGSEVDILDCESVKELKKLMGQMVKGFKSICKKV